MLLSTTSDHTAVECVSLNCFISRSVNSLTLTGKLLPVATCHCATFSVVDFILGTRAWSVQKVRCVLSTNNAATGGLALSPSAEVLFLPLSACLSSSTLHHRPSITVSSHSPSTTLARITFIFKYGPVSLTPCISQQYALGCTPYTYTGQGVLPEHIR